VRFNPVHIVLLAPAGLLGPTLYATDYLTPAEAQRILFPEATDFASRPLVLDPEQTTQLREQVHLDPSRVQLVLATRQGEPVGYVLVDQVVGKTLLITYAVGFSTDKTIRGIEILSYRETHGGEVREKAWRRQFVGKTAASPLRLGDDIRNISGATLSCAHLTEGVRRLAALVAVGLP
jgi:hypothetical protein